MRRVDAEEPLLGRRFEGSIEKRLGRRDLERRQPGREAFAQKETSSSGGVGVRLLGGGVDKHPYRRMA